MAKQLKFSDDARQSLMSGINTVAKAVVTTLGPKGRNIALDKKWGAPNIVHDGVSVAKEIELPDPFENMGAQLVKEAASKTIKNKEEIAQVATISAGDAEIGAQIAEALGAEDRVVTVEDGKGLTLE